MKLFRSSSKNRDDKVTLKIPDKDGNIVEKEITKKEFDELVSKGIIRPADTVDTVEAHILDPMQGYYVTNWIVDEDIAREDVEDFATPDGKIYVMIAYVDGEPQIMFAKKEIWEKQRSIFEMIGRGEDWKKALEELKADLKKKIDKEKK